ncbi:hypothetical protein [Chitinophaga pinensis]|uniref:Uncharacterized protein n=1 Tax=Chitinophaga pinensis TaxID=79329 RepID=A0A5C6LNH7_9BACT|nr:hypothetical protein [Chitinophaga pinensis]TWV96203.1 hypothetical protein FEF09_23745 [Chitinophaga pinensis]
MKDKSIIADQLNDLEELMVPRRKDLLTWWLKFFSAIFVVAGIFGVFIYPYMFLMETDIQVALYGLQSTDRTSFLMLVITMLFILKGVASFGLLTEKEWAVDIGLADGWVGILVCVFVMIYNYFGPAHIFAPLGLELILLSAYLVKLQKIRTDWKRGRGRIS